MKINIFYIPFPAPLGKWSMLWECSWVYASPRGQGRALVAGRPEVSHSHGNHRGLSSGQYQQRVSSSGGHLCFSYKGQIIKSSPETFFFVIFYVPYNLLISVLLKVELIEFKVNLYVFKIFYHQNCKLLLDFIVIDL